MEYYNIIEYLKSFVIGSSYLPLILFFIGVQSINPEKRTYSFDKYALFGPIYFGIANMVILYMQRNTKCKKNNIYLMISILSFLYVAILAKSFNVYKYNKEEWIRYFISLFVLHFITINITIKYLNLLFLEN